jgi:membrane fusion protein YbhG
MKKRLILVSILGIAGLAIWWFGFRGPDAPPGVIALSGRIEGDDSAVAAKVGGRIREIYFREGDAVKGGQVVAVLDDEQVRAREAQAQAAVEQAQARVKMQEQQIAVLGAQLQQSQLGVGQARTDAEGRVRQAEGNLAAAQASLAQAEASYQLALFDRDAYTRLAKVGAASERQGRQAESTEQTQAALVAAARKQVDAAQGALTAARANLANPDIRSAQVSGVQKQIAQARSDVLAARADLSRAQAQLDEARANRKDLNVIAPFDGTVATRAAEPGEVVAAGTPILTVIDLSKVYLRGFIPEGEIGQVRLGQPARVYLDSAPNTPLEAFVSRVDPQASFTPENTYFRNDRVKQVIGVKLQLKHPAGLAKPGMPADGEILVEGTNWPAGGRHK